MKLDITKICNLLFCKDCPFCNYSSVTGLHDCVVENGIHAAHIIKNDKDLLKRFPEHYKKVLETYINLKLSGKI